MALAQSALAQSTSSTLTGVVADASQAVVANARITVVNESTGVALTARSNDAGLYRVVGLSPATYRIEVEAAGFQRLVRPGVQVQISQVLQVDLALQLGAVQETVSVTAAAPVLDAQSSTVGQVVERQMIAGMPMPNRNSAALIALIPGATIQNVTGDIPIFSVGGGRMRNQQFTMDGGNHTNTVGLAVNQSQVPMPMDAMQEFRVLANNYSAEYGQSQSGVVTLATRAGTNRWRGSLFEYARNEALDARNFFAARRAKFRQHQFGGVLGGPVRKDKTHFFVTYERTQQVTGATAIQTQPTAAQRQGDFSTTRDAQGRMIPIYDPATGAGAARQPFANNRIPDARIDPVSRNISTYWPQPNLPGTVTGANNFSQNTRPSLNRNLVIGRFDHQFNSTNQFMARYFISDQLQVNPGIWPDRSADPSAATTDQRTQNILGTWTRSLRSNLLNEFRLGLVRRDFFNQRAGKDTDFASKLGLRGVSKAGFPIIGVTGFAGLSGAPFRFSSPLLDYQIQDAVSWFRGKHAVKAGIEARQGVFNDDTDTSSSGNFSFGPQQTAQGTAGGNGFATFLLGLADSANIIRPDPIRSRASYWGAYIQDDWRLTNRFTVNLGLRWEGTGPRVTDQDRMNSFDTRAVNPVSGTPGVITFAGRNGVPRGAYDFDKTNFGPRVGFAWRAMERTVIRAGGGIIYGSSVNAIVGTAATLGFSTDFRLASTEPGVTAAVRLRDGFPALTRPTVDQLGAGFGAVRAGQATTTAVTFFERSRPTPISLQYNLDIQREVRQNLLVEIGYMANLSHHLSGPDLSLNQVPPDRLAAGNAQARRPYPQFTNVSVINPNLGNSAYHAGFAKVERRFEKGLTLLAHYTFSRYLDDAESFSEFGDVGSYMDFYNRRLDRGPSGSQVRHRSVVSAVYDLPALRGHGWLAPVFGGWRTGAIATFQTGPPFTVFSSVNQTNAFPAGALRADLVGSPRIDTPTIARWFNTAAFAPPGQFRFGNAGRGILNGPGLWNFDSSFIKTFSIREPWKLEVRAEFFNLLNHANFSLPGRSTGVPAFGIISSALAGRSSQLVARIEF
jgi:hypothetical protein